MPYCVLKQIQGHLISEHFAFLRSINNFCHGYGVCLCKHSVLHVRRLASLLARVDIACFSLWLKVVDTMNTKSD